LTAYLYVDSSKWITTNYTTITFNRTTLNNFTNGVQVNLTVPATAMDGTYEGYIQYLDVNRAGIKIPIRAYVTASMLLVNNTFNSDVYRVDEDYGANLTRTVFFNISNLGSNTMTLNFSDSVNLSCYSGSCTGYNASFEYNSTPSIAANSYKLINVTITFNSSLPKNTVYSGWIFINATNETSNLTAHPYSGFTITLRLNMTDLLDVKTDFMSNDGSDKIIGNASLDENVTIKLDTFYLNGTGPITDFAGLSNFTSVWLQEGNISSSDGRIPASGSLNLSNGTNPIYCRSGSSCPSWGGDDHFYINATVPANRPGGRYDVYAVVNYSRGSFTFSGVGVNRSLIVNNTGLYMTTTNSTSFSMGNTSTYVFAINVSNYGPLAASSATINLTESCAGYSIAYTSMTGSCLGSGSGATATISPPAYNTSCVVWWTITASASASACTTYAMGGPTSQWFNPNNINVSITISGGGTTETTTLGSSSQSTTTTVPTYTANLAFTKADSLIAVQQNSSNSTEVGVSNTGNVNQNITFAIENISSSWYSINATNAYLVVGKGAGFKINFNVGNVEVKDYNGVFKAFSVNKTITSNFVLRITPAPTTKIEINDTLVGYKVDMIKLGQDISQKKKQGFNTTAVEKKFADLNSTIQKAEDYIKAGDYNSAYYLFDNIKSLLSEIKDDLSKVKKSGWSGLFTLPEGYTLYILVGGGIAVAGVLTYLFWPTKGLAKTAYTVLKTEEVKKVKVPSKSIIEPIKKLFSELKEKLSKIFKREKIKSTYAFNESSKT